MSTGIDAGTVIVSRAPFDVPERRLVRVAERLATSTVCSAPAQAGGGICGMNSSPLPMLMSSSRVNL